MCIYYSLPSICVFHCGLWWRSFRFTSVDSALKIHLRAARAFLGLAKTTPIPGILSEFNLITPQYRNQTKMVRQYHRLLKMSNDRLTKKVFNWDKMLNDRVQANWYSEVQNIFSNHNLEEIFESSIIFDLKSTLDKLKKSMLLAQQNDLKFQCSTKPKLRTFIKFKDFHTTPPYIKKPLSFIQRKFMAWHGAWKSELRLVAMPAQGSLKKPEFVRFVTTQDKPKKVSSISCSNVKLTPMRGLPG